MVEAARRAAAHLGVTNVTHQVLDADRLELPDEHVDGIVCRWGYMLVVDPAGALAESRRVLRRSGRAALAVWAESERNPWGTAVGRALLEHGLIDVPDRDAPGPFRLGKPGLLESAIDSARLELLSVEDVLVEWRVPSADSFWEIAVDLSTTARRAVDEAAADVLANVRRRVGELLEPYAAGSGLVIPGVSRLALARRGD
jgi:SAM-dependent methyltransferase